VPTRPSRAKWLPRTSTPQTDGTRSPFAPFAQVSQHGEHLFEAFCEFVSLHRLGCVRSVCDCSAAICRLSLASSSANKAALIWPA
jgi:hypothetical protein